MRMRLMLVCCLALLGGCASGVSKVSFGQPALPASIDFEYVDNRPARERITSRENIGSIALHTLGDDYISPNASEILKSEIYGKGSDVLHGHKIVVESIRITVETPLPDSDQANTNRSFQLLDLANQQQHAAGVSPGVAIAGALLADLVIRAFEKANEETISSIAVIITGKIDKKAFSENAFSTYSEGVGEQEIKEAISEAVDKTTQTILRLVHQS